MALLGIKKSLTTSYHPQANGMVERFHRQLKAALKPQPNDWMPTLHLGVRTALKQDLNSSTAEIVYGTTLRLPGAFITPSPTTSLPHPSEFLNKLKSYVKPTSQRQNTSHVSIPQALSTATHVSFVTTLFVNLYNQDASYPVIKRTDKYYTKRPHTHYFYRSVETSTSGF